MKRKLEKKINLFLSMIIIVILLPLMITITSQRMKLESLLSGGLEAVAQGTEQESSEIMGVGNETAIVVTDEIETERDASDRSAEAESRIPGIVAKEISASSSSEVILAQSVIARTNLYDAWETGTAEPEGLELSEMQTLWGEDFQKIYQRLKECTARTKGQVLLWNGNYIYAPYHAVSAGTTRNISELYKDVVMPYLQTVACPEDTTAEGYLGVLYWGKNEFLEKCIEAFPDAAPESPSEIVVESRDTADYVLTVKIGEKMVTGEEFRSSFTLNSACFSITEVGEKVRIVTKGIGHGVGLSQHTAAHMAREGKDYREILEYFYPGAELGSVKESN